VAWRFVFNDVFWLCGDGCFMFGIPDTINSMYDVDTAVLGSFPE
jgi:hypothetical protein